MSEPRWTTLPVTVEEDVDLAIALSLSHEENEQNRSAKEEQIKSDEALAKEFATLEREGKASADKISQSDADFALMLHLSSEQNGEGPMKSTDRSMFKADSKTGDDESVALALQQKLDQEAAAESLAVREKRDGSGGGGGGVMDSLMNAFKGLGSGSSLDPHNKRCSACGSIPFDGRMVVTRGRAYCPGCMRCKVCRRSLNSQVYHHPSDPSPSGLYCFDCLQEKHGVRCAVCRNFLHGQYLRHNFFESEKYCLTHEQIENRRKCTSCHRIEPMPDPSSGKGPFVDLPDGRHVCLECLDSAVMTTDEMAALYVSVVDFMEEELELSIPAGMRQVPVLAVDAASLNSEIDRGALTHSGPGTQHAQTRGLTLSRSGQLRHYSAGDLSFSWTRGWQVGPGRVHQVETVREVTAVLVLYGLPRDLTASILAHEATHVLLRLLKDVPLDLALPAEEGLCQVVAHRFLQHQHRQSQSQSQSIAGAGAAGKVRTGGFDFHRSSSSSSSSSSASAAPALPRRMNIGTSHRGDGGKDGEEDPSLPLEAKLRGYFLHSIEHDPSPVYGDGFRHAKRVVDALGLHIALEELRHRRTLPDGV